MVQINEQQWNLLWERKQNHRLPHALLLTGSAGLGKLEFAKQFSEACLCENVSVEGVPCKVCHSCSCFNA
ncbi:MAG: hypothetical protein JSS53_08280, partial [Proteobacteria bacterium]|nr:hypothetical protein [Pseudomonadota bacterium]